MNAFQLYLLIGLIFSATFLVWLGYMLGRSDGRITGFEEGKTVKLVSSAKTIRELNASLQHCCTGQKHLALHCQRLEDSQNFGPNEHLSLLNIAENLRIAAETFSAFRTGKKLERESLELREQALVMAAILAPVAKEAKA